MVGAAVKAGPGPEALEGAGGWVGTAATFVARRYIVNTHKLK